MTERNNKATDSYPEELLADLSNSVEESLLRCGVGAEVAKRAGMDAAENVRRRWGGTQLYIPKGHQFEITAKHLAVWDEFTGDNHNALAMKHGIGYQQVCRIIREMRTQQVRLRQRDIFDDKAGLG